MRESRPGERLLRLRQRQNSQAARTMPLAAGFACRVSNFLVAPEAAHNVEGLVGGRPRSQRPIAAANQKYRRTKYHKRGHGSLPFMRGKCARLQASLWRRALSF